MKLAGHRLVACIDVHMVLVFDDHRRLGLVFVRNKMTPHLTHLSVQSHFVSRNGGLQALLIELIKLFVRLVLVLPSRFESAFLEQTWRVVADVLDCSDLLPAVVLPVEDVVGRGRFLKPS